MNWKQLDPDGLDHDELIALCKNLRRELDKVTSPLMKEIKDLKVQLGNERRKVKRVYKNYRAWRVKHKLPPDNFGE